jgi:hypothetical protein
MAADQVFGSVLPNHLTLNQITFEDCCVGPRHEHSQCDPFRTAALVPCLRGEPPRSGIPSAHCGRPPKEHPRPRTVGEKQYLALDRCVALWYPRYVAALERNAATTRTTEVYLANFRFDGSPSPGINIMNRWNEGAEGEGAEEDAARGDADHLRPRAGSRIRRASNRLFASILPSMPSLNRLTLENFVVEPEDLRAFFENLPPDREMNYLSFSLSDRDHGCVRLVVAALRRNLRLRELWMTVNRLDYDLYKSICDSAVENGTVRLLAVCPDGWEGDRRLDVGAVRQVLENRWSSSVRHFRICGNGGDWAPDLL